MIAWLALGFSLFCLAVIVSAVAILRRFWRQVEPQVRGLAGMLGLGPTAKGSGDDG